MNTQLIKFLQYAFIFAIIRKILPKYLIGKKEVDFTDVAVQSFCFALALLLIKKIDSIQPKEKNI